MREIKFKGYSVQELVGSQWIEGFGILDIKYTDGTTDYIMYTHESNYKVYPESIGQYIGLKDINKKEIFEKDVVQYVDDMHVKRTGVVVFKNGSFVIENPYITSYRLSDYSIEVIGNSFDKN